MSDDPEYKTGYGKPPREHQFKKNQSGNPRGRPPKEVRAISPRQRRGDIIRAYEEEIEISIGGRKRKMSVKEAVERIQVRKALAGHGPSIRAVLKRYDEALEGHAKAHKCEIEDAERLELSLTKYFAATGQRREGREAINSVRKKTRHF